MNQSDYDKAVHNEFRTGDKGDNIHAGVDERHSSGCTVLGNCPNSQRTESERYQTSLEEDVEFKAAIACAQRISPGVKIKTNAGNIPELSAEPVIPRAIPVNEN